MHFLMWQQTVLIIAFAAMLLLCILLTYHLTKGPRPLRSTLLRLAAASFIGSLAWLLCVVLSNFTYIGLSDDTLAYSLVQRTYNATFGFPFTIAYYDQLRAIFGLSPTLRSPILDYLIAATIPLTLLLISSLVTLAEKLLAKSTPRTPQTKPSST